MVRYLFIFSALLIGKILFAQPAATQVSIGITDSIYSAVLKEGRNLKIYLPHSYNESTAVTRRYPLIYLLDAAANFKPLAGMMDFLSAGIDDGSLELPEMIIVAIENTDRTRDLTPTHTLLIPGSSKPNDYLQSSGGGENFIRFIEKELIPYVDSAYRTARYRTLIGHSFGGLTAINIFLNHAGLFNAFLVIDPSLWWNDQYFLNRGSKPWPRENLRISGFLLPVRIRPPMGAIVAQQRYTRPRSGNLPMRWMSIKIMGFSGSGKTFLQKSITLCISCRILWTKIYLRRIPSNLQHGV